VRVFVAASGGQCWFPGVTRSWPWPAVPSHRKSASRHGLALTLALMSGCTELSDTAPHRKSVSDRYGERRTSGGQWPLSAIPLKPVTGVVTLRPIVCPEVLRVVGHLPGERRRASIRHDLRAGVAQASREETAATATGGCSRHRSYGDLSAMVPAAQADREVIGRSMTLPAISACVAPDVGAGVEWANSLAPAGKTRVCPASAASVRVGNGLRCWHARVVMTEAVREWFDSA